MASGFKLMDAFRSQVKKLKSKGVDSKAEFDVQYPTGFLALDFLNGCVIHVESDTINTTYNSIGIVDGSANTFIGRSNCGKSTFIMQTAANIIRPFSMGKLYVDDIEGSLPQFRKEALFKFSKEEFQDRVDMRNTGITTENVYQRIKLIHDLKLENREVFEYDTGLYDTDGNRIYKLQPTVYIIDSLPMLMPEDIATDDELKGGMSAAQIAKSNTEIVKKIVQLNKEANIILFTINHILDDIQINPFSRKQAQIAGLKEGERLTGGKAAVYLANNMFRLDDIKMLKESEGFHIDGSIVEVTIIKSRTNRTRRSVPLIFNKTTGEFDNDLSLYQLLKDNGRIGGAGAYMYLNSLPEVRFAQKNFKETLYSNPELQTAFAKECYDVLKDFLSDMAIEHYDENASKFNINDLILSSAMQPAFS